MVTWTKNGEPLDTKRVGIRNSDRDSILFIRTSEIDDSGVYEMTVKVDSFADKASLTLQIVGEQNTNYAIKNGIIAVVAVHYGTFLLLVYLLVQFHNINFICEFIVFRVFSMILLVSSPLLHCGDYSEQQFKMFCLFKKIHWSQCNTCNFASATRELSIAPLYGLLFSGQ